MGSQRPLNITELPRISADLRALADLMDRGDAVLLQRLYRDIADNGYSTTASGAAANGSGGSGELTPVEAKASKPDRAADTARMVLSTQRAVWAGVVYLLAEHHNHNPSRPTAMWPCGCVKVGDYRRCPECIPPGVCDTCGRTVPKGRDLHRAIAMDQGGRELMEDDQCWKWRIRHGGRTRGGGAADLVLSGDVVVAEGA